MLGLGIESSCDETALALVKDGRECLANTIASQIEKHAPFHGVVPEIASRAHLEKINFVYEETLRKAGAHLEDIDYIALTVQPGLVGSLMIGGAFAKILALVADLPIVRVDHVEAHLYAPCLEAWEPQYPFLGLLLSGGNSAIYRAEAPGKLETLADTMDDACGEAFDKVASILKLERSYPGGPAVEREARKYFKSLKAPASSKQGQKEAQKYGKDNAFPPSLFKPLLKNHRARELGFSFSGIKTAVMQVQKKGMEPARICYDFQNTVFDLVARNVRMAAKSSGIRNVIAGGGVLANENLRERLDLLTKEEGLQIRYPQNKVYCTDNAAMVAALGYFLRNGPSETRSLDFGVDSRRPYLPNETGSLLGSGTP